MAGESQGSKRNGRSVLLLYFWRRKWRAFARRAIFVACPHARIWRRR